MFDDQPGDCDRLRNITLNLFVIVILDVIILEIYQVSNMAHALTIAPPKPNWNVIWYHRVQIWKVFINFQSTRQFDAHYTLRAPSKTYLV